jgi:Icc protein
MMAWQDTPLRVVQITDMHIMSQPGGKLWGVDVDASLQAVLQRLKTQHGSVELILATGDLVNDEGPLAYERLHAFLLPLGIAVYCLPGNHDRPAVLNQVLAAGPVRRERHIISGNWQFILLDSSLPDSTAGHLAASELAFLENTLTAYSQYALVCLHHQPLPIGSPWLDTMVVDNGAELLAIVDRHPQVRAVIWGHIHQAFAAQRGGVALLGTPSTCVQFKPDTADATADSVPPGYRWFELYGDGRLLTGIERTGAIV